LNMSFFRQSSHVSDLYARRLISDGYNVRSGADQFARRGGMSYFREHMRVFRYMRDEGLISYPVLLQNYVLRFAQVAFPTRLRTWVYQHLLRHSHR